MTLPIADGPVPKHEQLRSLLESRIAAEFSPGDPLPGERALEEEYGVSRITVRRAIGDLVAAGRLRTVSYGKERPLAICSTEECYSKNRRAVTAVSPGAGM